MGDPGASEAKDKSTGKGKQSSDDASLNLDEIRELAELVNEHGFTDFEFENENIRVRLSKQVNTPVYAAPQMAAPVQAAPAGASPSATAESVPAVVDEDASLHKITSPIVGTFYRSPAPDKPSYVSEGSVVSPESVVCIVEAMKLMNEIQAETSGEIVKIYVENGAPVEYGQPLFGIRK
ncbi:MAG TPA: acetyl-CoA carboxylase biotin carboxyl carrier protein [Pyrinomonadaceae bacterium]|nr:acetyl-CoA carboxylase biotin carboxyl carrier protein [Pyrinomonadaceae bacterium]